MISFAHAYLLWVLAALPLLAAWWWWRGRQLRLRHVSLGAGIEPLRRRSPAREALRAVLLWLGLGAGIIAAAGPRWGEAEQLRHASGADLVIAFDCSRSMLATDLYPDRLHLARREALDLLEKSPDIRVALLPFAAIATRRCPLTGDHLAIATLLDDCDPDFFPAEAGLQGTAIGRAVQTGLDVLARESGAGQAILVISDGADPDQAAVKAAASVAKQRGVPVYGLFVGDTERSVEVQIDGRAVTMTADRGTLDDLAKTTGAITVNATVNDDDVTTLAAHLSDHLARRPWEERSRTVSSEHYQWPLAIAVLLFAAGWLIPTSRRMPGLLAVLLCLSVSQLAAAEPWRELAQISNQAKTDAPGARAALEQVLLQHPDSAATHYNLGCLQLDSDPAGAARHFESATHSPQMELSADAWHNLALARLKLGQFDEAMSAADEALRRRPDLADFIRTRDELRRALIARADAKRLKAEEEAKRLRLASRALPPARLGEAYSATLAASGGTAPYRFSAKVLPAGLELASDGAMHGTPTKADKHQLAITVDDAAKGGATGTVALEVLPAPAITTSELPEAILSIPYRAELQCEGLLMPRWSIAGLPAGLTTTMGPNGAAIVGTPTALGSSTVQVSAEDAGHHATRELVLMVTDSFTPAESRLPPATAFSDYQHRLTVRGRPIRYQWHQPQSEHGITIAPDGAGRGAPDKAGDLSLHATIAAEDGRTRDFELVLPVNPPPVIEEDKEIKLTRGQAVNRPLKVTGGTPPYHWSGSGGPAGVRIDPDGTLRGAPSQSGETELSISCEDHWKAATELQVKITVEDRKDPSDDQKKQDSKDQEKKDQEKKEQEKKEQDSQQQDQAKQDQPEKKDGSGQDQKPGEEQKANPDGEKPQPDPQPAQQSKPEQGAAQDQAKKPDAPGDKPNDGKPDAPVSLTPAEQAANRWIENLPKDDRNVLRLQLLDGKSAPSKGSDTPW